MKRLTHRLLACCVLPSAFVLAACAQGIEATLLTTFTHPTSSANNLFGCSVTTVGGDRVLIGCSGGSTDQPGSAFLFSTNGALLTTFSNNIILSNNTAHGFGRTVRSLGDDKLIIMSAGAAYLFSTNGTLLTTFTNPAFGEGFTFYMATSVGPDCVLVGSTPDYDQTETRSGVAYLFHINGTLLTTFTNPNLANTNGNSPYNDQFGFDVSALAKDRVIISSEFDNTGAHRAGAAYLFATNGTLLTTFTNPNPSISKLFGWSLSALGEDFVVIGAPSGSAGAINSGSAYLFTTNGTLLMTITNPTPADSDFFSRSVAPLGSGNLLISSEFDDTGAVDAGSVYIFSTNGALLTTLTNPTPAFGDYFGTSMAAVGSNRFLIGTLGLMDAGVVYLYSVTGPGPKLTIKHETSSVSVSWITEELGLILQQAEALSTPTTWTNASELVSTNGLTNVVLQTIPADATNRFYRLRRP